MNSNNNNNKICISTHILVNNNYTYSNIIINILV